MRTLSPHSTALLCLLAGAACAGVPSDKPPSGSLPGTTDDRATLNQQFLEMFARAYYPGRSGQIMLVPEPGNIPLEPNDPFYRFMHGSPWDYDVEIPLILHGQGHIRQGVFDAPVTHRDIAPTIASLLNVPTPATMSGTPLIASLANAAEPPRIVFVAVLDGARRDFFDRFVDDLPTLNWLKNEGAWYSQARIDYLPSLTSVGHASIATGAEPRVHGVVANTMYDRRSARPSGPFPDLSPASLYALTIADLWNLNTQGDAVIIGQGTTARATIPMAGHGGCLVSAQSTIMAMFDGTFGGWVTNDECYRLPSYVANDKADRLWQAGETWLGHEIHDSSTLLRTGRFITYQVDALVSMIEREQVGKDEVPDLILANFKTLDYIGHRWGPDSDELAEALRDLDRELGRVIGALESAAGDNGFVTIIVSDHGTPGEPEEPEHARYYITDIIEAVHDRFDPTERRVILFYGDPADNQFFVDRSRLENLGFNLESVATYLEALPYIFSAYTEDEVAAVSGR